jgi:hypothetical protein
MNVVSIDHFTSEKCRIQRIFRIMLFLFTLITNKSKAVDMKW